VDTSLFIEAAKSNFWPIIGVVGAVIVSAVTVASIVGTYGRRRVDRTRSQWRNQDVLQGWVDDRGLFHLGVIDTVNGWQDDQGVWHAGHVTIVPDHERRILQLEEDPHEA
jgi:hypothetical protein